jgi:tetratricopeptide (TPR) repeat protein
LLARRLSLEFRAAPQELAKTVGDLERRGLLQYDVQAKRYDLHPVVRGIAAGGLRQEEKQDYGQRVVDHFTRQAHNPYEEAETLDDLRNSLQIVRTLLQMGRYQEAYDVFKIDLNRALFHNLEAYAEALSLLGPFFPQGWAILPEGVVKGGAATLVNEAAYLLYCIGESEEALVAFGASLRADLQQGNWREVPTCLLNIANTLFMQNRQAKAISYFRVAIDVATLNDDKGLLFRTQLDLFCQLAIFGQWEDAQAIWQLLDPMGRDWKRDAYRSGYAEYWYALFRFWQGELREAHLDQAEQLARAGRNRQGIRALYGLRGAWLLEQGQWVLAAESFHEAVRMAREVGQTDESAETLLAVARFHLNQLPDPRHEAEQLAGANYIFHRGLAELWLLIGDTERASQHALAAYKLAWADGEPYVSRYELNKASALLEQLGAEIPNLPPYDPTRDEKLPWEDEVVAAIEKLRAEVNVKQQSENEAEARGDIKQRPAPRSAKKAARRTPKRKPGQSHHDD